jgi:hypothetical protein
VKKEEFDEIIQQSLSRAKDISKKQFTKEYDILWHDEINFLAETLEEKYISMGQDWAIENISREITRMYKEQDIRVWANVERYLPPKFKLKNNNNYNFDNSVASAAAIEYSSSRLPSLEGDLLEQLSNVVQNISHAPATNVAQLEHLFAIGNKQCKNRAKDEHIALYPDENSSSADQINQGMQGDRPRVTTDHPRPHGSKSRDAIARCIKVFQEIHDRFFDFPPEILEKDDEIAAGFDTIPVLFKPGLDLKYSKNWLDWWTAEKYRDIYGKHAAGVISFSVTNLCANCSDENTREWVRMDPVSLKAYDTYECFQCGYRVETVCPSCNLSMKLLDKPIRGWQCQECGNSTPMTRDLTREQIGDKTSIVMDAAIKVMNHIPFFVSFCSWFRDWTDPYIAGRKIRLSGDLSDRA